MGWIEQCDSEAAALSKEMRQQVLSELRTGKTIGETCKKFNLPLWTVCGVVDMNIVEHDYLSLNRESV